MESGMIGNLLVPFGWGPVCNKKETQNSSINASDLSIFKYTHYQPNVKKINYIYEYNPSNGNAIKLTYYRSDGKTKKETMNTIQAIEI